jgi:hypothetical protein
MAELTRREALGAGVIVVAAGLTSLAQGQGTAPTQAGRWRSHPRRAP